MGLVNTLRGAASTLGLSVGVENQPFDEAGAALDQKSEDIDILTELAGDSFDPAAIGGYRNSRLEAFKVHAKGNRRVDNAADWALGVRCAKTVGGEMGEPDIADKMR